VTPFNADRSGWFPYLNKRGNALARR
jgi:hypothetical protein